jgi:hypothetical protein
MNSECVHEFGYWPNVNLTPTAAGVLTNGLHP